MKKLLSHLPRGNTLDDAAWGRRHRLLQWVLGVHLPALACFGIFLGHGVLTTLYVLVVPTLCLVFGHIVQSRRPASVFITAGLTYCSAALVGLTYGSIEAHFHFFIIIGFIALYQDWVPFLWNVLFTVLSHGLGSVWQSNLIFNHPAGQLSPWLWSAIHGAAVLLACVGMVIFWRISEEEQQHREALTRQLADAEVGRRRFTSDLLVNLARRNQSMLYRQLDIINQLEEKERDPDALAELFRLDHLATRVRRNAESLLVLAGEQPTRVWSAAVPLRDVVRAAIAETEDLERVVFAIDESLAVAGHTVTDLTHLLAELTENAVRFSPPQASVSIRTRRYLNAPGAHLLTVEDWGVGMPPAEIAAANELLTRPPEVDLAVSQRLGFHVVARLAQRHGIGVSLTPTPGCGVTAVVVLPAELFESGPQPAAELRLPVPVMAGAPGEPNGAAHNGVAAHRANRLPQAGGPMAPSGRPTAEEPRPARASVPAQATPPAVETRRPGPTDDGWVGWWRAAVPQQSTVRDQAGAANQPPLEQLAAAPAEPPSRGANGAGAHSAGANGGAAADGGGGPRLNRRVPQSHLAPELREPQPERAPATAPAHALHASEALSRYQASRQAAQAQMDDGGSTGGAGAPANAPRNEPPR